MDLAWALVASVLVSAAAEPPKLPTMIPGTMTDIATTIPTAARGIEAGQGCSANGVRLIPRLAILIITIVLVIPVGIIALGSGAGWIALPFEMFELARRAPILFPAHMVSSALALLLVPAVILTRQRPQFHRPLGRLLGLFVVIGGLTALPVALLSHSAILARAGFFVQGLVWLYLLAAAYFAIRSHDIPRHAYLMMAMVAVTTGAVWFRLIIGMAIAFRLPFEPTYTAAAWLGWMAPLAFILIKPRLVMGLVSR